VKLAVLENLKVHHSKPVKAGLAENAERIEVFYLPPNSTPTRWPTPT